MIDRRFVHRHPGRFESRSPAVRRASISRESEPFWAGIVGDSLPRVKGDRFVGSTGVWALYFARSRARLFPSFALRHARLSCAALRGQPPRASPLHSSVKGKTPRRNGFSRHRLHPPPKKTSSCQIIPSFGLLSTGKCRKSAISKLTRRRPSGLSMSN